MNENAKFLWTSGRCSRLLRPLSSKIALLRKTTLSEPRHDDCNSGTVPLSASQNFPATTKVETGCEVSPRPWKKIKRTYSSKTNSQSFRESGDREKARAHNRAGDDVIRLPLHLMTDQAACHAEKSAVNDSQYDLLVQSAPTRAARATPKNLQILHGSQSRSGAVSTGLSNRRLKEGICKALESLLRATTCETTRANGRCRSLFSICSRQIPNYIAEEQRIIINKDPENDIDVASEVYTDLAAFGSAPDGGWESLREVVRAHGMSLVREAIHEGLIEFPLSRHILCLCLGLAAYDEAEGVIESMIAKVKFRPLLPKEITGLCPVLSHPAHEWATSHGLQATSLTDEVSRVVGALVYYVSQTGRHGFMYRQTAVMLEDGVLPVDWISSKSMIECWNGVIRSIAEQDDHAQSAALLLQVASSKSYRRGVLNAKANPRVHDVRLRACRSTSVRLNLRSYKAGQTVEIAEESQPMRSGKAGARPYDEESTLQPTFSKILAVLSAINILQSFKLGLDPLHPDLLSVEILRVMALEIRQALELANVTSYADCNLSMPTRQLRLPLISSGLISVVFRKAGTETCSDEVRDLAALASLPSSRESVGNAASFLCEVARCCDEAESRDGFRFVQSIVHGLISIATSNIYDRPTRILCSNIAHAAAFAFSEDTGQAKHLEWALEIEGTITRTAEESPKMTVDSTPVRAVIGNKHEYKWEEGICEWIAKTPALILEGPGAIKDEDHNSTDREASRSEPVEASPLLSLTTPSATDWRLSRPKRRTGGGASCDPLEIAKMNRSCGNPSSSEKLLFIRISPHPHKIRHSQSLLKVDAANDLDELSTSESFHEKPIALREIPNPPSGVKRKRFSQKCNGKIIGSYNLDMPPTKRHRWDLETFSEITDDELGLP